MIYLTSVCDYLSNKTFNYLRCTDNAQWTVSAPVIFFIFSYQQRYLPLAAQSYSALVFLIRMYLPRKILLEIAFRKYVAPIILSVNAVLKSPALTALKNISENVNIMILFQFAPHKEICVPTHVHRGGRAGLRRGVRKISGTIEATSD